MVDEVYTIGPDDGRVSCAICNSEGKRYPQNDYGVGEAVLGDSLISPFGDGSPHYYCLEHLVYLGNNVVIYEPSTPVPGFKREISLEAYKARAIAAQTQ